MKTFGDRVRSCRRESCMTQEQLAVKAGTNQAVIQKIENGKSLRPRKIDEIAKVLEVNPAWLMFGPQYANKEIPYLGWIASAINFDIEANKLARSHSNIKKCRLCGSPVIHTFNCKFCGRNNS